MNSRTIGKRAKHLQEQLPAVHRRAEVAHIPREDGIKLVEQLYAAHLGRERRFLRLPNLIADLAIESNPDPGLEAQLHRHLVLLAGKLLELARNMAQLDVVASPIARQRGRCGDQRLTSAC